MRNKDNFKQCLWTRFYPRLKFTLSFVASLFPEQCMGTRMSALVWAFHVHSSFRKYHPILAWGCRKISAPDMENLFLTSFPLLFLPLLVAPSPPVSILPSLNSAFPCATNVAAGLTTYDISDGERGEKVGERGWGLRAVCLRYSASLDHQSLHPLFPWQHSIPSSVLLSGHGSLR